MQTQLASLVRKARTCPRAAKELVEIEESLGHRTVVSAQNAAAMSDVDCMAKCAIVFSEGESLRGFGKSNEIALVYAVMAAENGHCFLAEYLAAHFRGRGDQFKVRLFHNPGFANLQ